MRQLLYPWNESKGYIAFWTWRKIKGIKNYSWWKKWNVMENRLSYSEWGDYFSLEKKAKAIALEHQEKLK